MTQTCEKIEQEKQFLDDQNKDDDDGDDVTQFVAKIEMIMNERANDLTVQL